jgi:hypothetical protein
MLPLFTRRCPDTCETCRFWQPDEDFDDNVLGECRLKVPDTAALARLVRKPWPLTESRDWCLDWQVAGR